MAEYIERSAALAAVCVGCELYDEDSPCGCAEKEEILAIPAADVVEVSGLTPCDVCAYNPPSSGDGKPCVICPARAKGEKNDTKH